MYWKQIIIHRLSPTPLLISSVKEYDMKLLVTILSSKTVAATLQWSPKVYGHVVLWAEIGKLSGLAVLLRRLKRVFYAEGSKLTQSLSQCRAKSYEPEMKGASLPSITFMLKICSLTYVEIFHAISIQLYLTFKTFFKKSVVCNFFKS